MSRLFTHLFLRCILLISCLLAGFATRCCAEDRQPEFSASDLEFFEKEVRPILANRCYECHSGQNKQPKGGLRADSRAALLAGGDTGPAIIPGDPRGSLFIDAINYGDTYQMPPKSRLPATEVAVLTKWVERGAPWPKETARAAANASQFDLAARKAAHWCWRSVQLQQPPAVKNTAWPRQDLDRFILAKLEERGLSPATPAGRHTLLRRVYFDLIGLPPTPEQTATFLNDRSPQAFEKVVDELLKSPHFGERWARHWMDLVRYAETCGHEFDYPIPNAWRYRDYLIRAFNADLPYDQMVIEQIAGDLIPNPRLHPEDRSNESILGTTFWWLHEAIHAPVDVRGDEAGRIDNQIDVFSKTFLGLTVACARCHDHKFDAISTQDYYALAGFLRSTRRQEALLDPGNKIRDAARQVALARKQADSELAEWVGKQRMPREADFARWRDQFVRELRQQDEKGTEYQVFADFENQQASFGDWTVTGEAFGSAPAAPGQWDSVASKPQFLGRGAAHSGLLSPKFQGVLRSPSFTINHSNIFYRVAGQGCEVRLIVDGYTMIEFHQLLFKGCKFPIDTGGKWVWHHQSGDLGMYRGHRAYIEVIDAGDGWAAIDEICFSNRDEPPATSPSASQQKIADNQKISSLKSLTTSIADQWTAAVEHWQAGRPTDSDIQFANWLLAHDLLGDENSSAECAAIIANANNRVADSIRDLPAPVKVVAAVDGTAENEHVFVRGNPRILGEEASRQLLVALVGPQSPIQQGSGRLKLAQQIADPSNPLTARVMVNRVWHHLFGAGIVPSVDNFGVLGELPSHPELLDYLAQQFITEGWSIKRLIRSLVLSSSYQMSSENNPAALEADPTNRLLNRMNIRRLEGEAIRDAMLVISGRLDARQFGPGVAVHITPFMQGRGKPSSSGPVDGAGRRSLYTEVRRNFLPPMMLAFDTPIPFNTVGRRNASNVPAQALILMNDPFVVEQSEFWANRLLANRELAFDERVNRAYQAAISRPPNSVELAEVRTFFKSQARQHDLSEEQALSDKRVWTDFCHVLFNVKEFTFLE